MPDIKNNLDNDFQVPDNSPSLTDTYQVDNSDRPVTFSLIFGPPGIAAMCSAKIDDQLLLSAQPGSLSSAPVGSNRNIEGKFLLISAIVTVSNQTPVPVNLTVDFSLSGGAGNYRHGLQQTAGNIGLSVYFNISIFFIAGNGS